MMGIAAESSRDLSQVDAVNLEQDRQELRREIQPTIMPGRMFT